jgi:glycosyltransferase involved in cell wall biosynthesis
VRMEKRDIYILALSARRGGGITYIKNLILYSDPDIRRRVTLIANQNLSDFAKSHGVHVIKPKFSTENVLLRLIWEFFVLPGVLSKAAPKVVFFPGGVIPIRAFGEWKTVTMFRNMIPFDPVQRKKWPLGFMRFRNWSLKILMSRSMERADGVIFISKFARSVIVDQCKLLIKKDTIIYHGVGEKFNCSSVVSPSSKYGTNYIVYPSIIDVYKSQKEVVAAYKILIETVGPQCPPLYLVGEAYGTYADEVEQDIKFKNLQNKVFLVGPSKYEDMPSIYQNSYCLIYASQSENCPNILLEGMAAGCSIVCSNCHPMPEFAGDSVLYFDPNNPSDLANKLHLLVTDNALRASLAEKAKQQSSRFDWITTFRNTWKFIMQ